MCDGETGLRCRTSGEICTFCGAHEESKPEAEQKNEDKDDTR
jgi:hypothetical protein